MAALLVGCDGSPPSSVEPRSPTAKAGGPLANCAEVPCTGVIGDARYEIELPVDWNGTLLLWSHGYRSTVPIPPKRKVPTHPETAPSAEVAKVLLAQGYALAGSSFARNGWAVAEGVDAGEQLYERFISTFGKPMRTYVWGASLGGLITQLLAEKHPEWVSGAAPMCGLLAGANLTFDVALDVTYAIKTLVYPQMKLARYSSFQDARANAIGAQAAVTAASKDQRVGVPKLLLIAALVDAEPRSSNDDGRNSASRLKGIVSSVVTAALYGTQLRWELEQRVGGNPSTNIATDYSTRITSSEAAPALALSPGSVARNLALLAQGERVAADPAARAAADKISNPSGVLKDPTVTLHTAVDPLVIVQNQSAFRVRVAAAKGEGAAKLLQIYTKPPARYTTAPFGAGHCNFTRGEWTGAVNVLDTMVRQSTRPSVAEITKAFSGDPGLALDFVAPPWPADLD